MSVSVRYIKQLERLNRAKKEKLYLLDYNITNDSKLEFKICGSTQNIYTVTLHNNKIRCNCPDGSVGCYYYKIICKHSCFILCKVLKGNENIFNPLKKRDDIIMSDDYMNSLFKEFSKIKDRLQNTSIAKKELMDKYKNHKKKDLNTNVNSNSNKPYKSIFKYDGDLSEKTEHDTCGICFDKLRLDKLMALCPTCRNIVHINCMHKWMNMGKDTCVYCRSNIWKNYKNEERKERGLPELNKKYESLNDM